MQNCSFAIIGQLDELTADLSIHPSPATRRNSNETHWTTLTSG